MEEEEMVEVVAMLVEGRVDAVASVFGRRRRACVLGVGATMETCEHFRVLFQWATRCDYCTCSVYGIAKA